MTILGRNDLCCDVNNCKYVEVTEEGLVIERKGKTMTLPVDTIVVCAGQTPLRSLQQELGEGGPKVFLIGGAQEAGELDAKRAIDQGTRLAAVIETAKSGEVFEAPVPLSFQIKQKVDAFRAKGVRGLL